MVLLCFSTYLIKGALVASTFSQLRMVILYSFIIPTINISTRKNLGGKTSFAHGFRGSARQGGRGSRGSLWQHGGREFDRGGCWRFAEPALHTGAPFAAPRPAPASWAVFFSLPCCTCSLSCPLGAFALLQSLPSAIQAFRCHHWNHQHQRLLWSLSFLSPPRSISCPVCLLYFW